MNLVPRAAARFALILGVAAILIGLPQHSSAAQMVLLKGFPRLKQQHSLTCESSAASMATRAAITETQIMSVMPRSPNPNFGFRGNPDGYQHGNLADYGVYANPIHRALLKFGYSNDVLTYAHDSDLRSYINRGWPVVTWITYQLQKAVPHLAVTNGVQYFLVPHEHAVLAVGYDAQGIVVIDPWTGNILLYNWPAFNRSWGYFGDMAVAVQPCVNADPVSGLHVTAMNQSALTWTWNAAANAAGYRVTVTVGKHNKSVFQGTTSAHTFTLGNPRPGATYTIQVASLNACGGATTALPLMVQLPADLPVAVTATPTPEETTVATVTATPGATGTPAPSVTATATPTP